MKVYVATQNDGIIGVYSTSEKAERKIKDKISSCKSAYPIYYHVYGYIIDQKHNLWDSSKIFVYRPEDL